jgi:hypothetical protein
MHLPATAGHQPGITGHYAALRVALAASGAFEPPSFTFSSIVRAVRPDSAVAVPTPPQSRSSSMSPSAEIATRPRTRAGTPSATEYGSMSRLTSECAPTTQ